MVNARMVNARGSRNLSLHSGEISRVLARISRFENPFKYIRGFEINYKAAHPACWHARIASKTAFKNKRLFTLKLPKGALPKITRRKGPPQPAKE